MTGHRADNVPAEHHLEALSSMPDCDLGEGTPDVRGWEVTSPTSVHLGTVRDLLVDLQTLRVRYLDVILDVPPKAGRRVLLPIGRVWINDALDEVVVPDSSSLDSLPAYDPAHFDRQFEHEVLATFGEDVASDFYAGEAFDTASGRAMADKAAHCGRRETDTSTTPCRADEEAVDAKETAANGIELVVVPDAAE